MTIDEWCIRNDVTNRQLQERLGVASRMTVHRYRTGERVPKPDVLRRIHDMTGGAVTANDFYGLTTAEEQAA